jgi:hypothetical protein
MKQEMEKSFLFLLAQFMLSRNKQEKKNLKFFYINLNENWKSLSCDLWEKHFELLHTFLFHFGIGILFEG